MTSGKPWDAAKGFSGRGGDAIRPPDEEHFICYPLRGDSLTYFTRSFGPWLVVIVAGVMLTAAGALWAVVIASPPKAHLLAGILAPVGLAAAIALVVFASRLGNRRLRTAEHVGTAPRYGAAVAWCATAAALLACLGVLLSLEGDAPYVALVAIGAPLALIAVPILAYETRSVRPAGTAEVGLALPLVAMPLIFVMRTDAPATTKLLFAAGAALTVALLTVAFGWIRIALARRFPGRTGPSLLRTDEVATWIGFVFTVALFLLWAGVAAAILVAEPIWVFGVIAAVAVTALLIALAVRFLRHVGLNAAFSVALVSVAIAANWMPLGLAIAWAVTLVVFPIRVLWKAIRRKPDAESWRETLHKRPPRLTRRQIFLILIAAVATVVSAADGFPLHGVGGRVVAYVLLALAVVVLFFKTPCPKAGPLKRRLRASPPDRWLVCTRVAKVGVVLAWYAVVVALVALPGDGWAVEASVTSLSALLIFLTPPLLWLVAPGEIWRASNDLLRGDLRPDEAAYYVSTRLNEHTKPVQVDPVRPVTKTTHGKPARRRLAATLYPTNPYRRNLLKDTWRTLISEISDTDSPPFFKSFLRVDVDQTTLRVRCFGVTGYERNDQNGDRPPTLEDEFTIDLREDALQADA